MRGFGKKIGLKTIKTKNKTRKIRALCPSKLDEFLFKRALNFVQNFFVKLLLVKKKVV